MAFVLMIFNEPMRFNVKKLISREEKDNLNIFYCVSYKDDNISNYQIILSRFYRR